MGIVEPLGSRALTAASPCSIPQRRMDVTYYFTSYLHSVVLSSDRHTLLDHSRFLTCPIVERMNSWADRSLPMYRRQSAKRKFTHFASLVVGPFGWAYRQVRFLY